MYVYLWLPFKVCDRGHKLDGRSLGNFTVLAIFLQQALIIIIVNHIRVYNIYICALGIYYAILHT